MLKRTHFSELSISSLLSFSYVHSKPINGYLTKMGFFQHKKQLDNKRYTVEVEVFFIENLTVFFIPKSQVVNISM